MEFVEWMSPQSYGIVWQGGRVLHRGRDGRLEDDEGKVYGDSRHYRLVSK